MSTVTLYAVATGAVITIASREAKETPKTYRLTRGDHFSWNVSGRIAGRYVIKKEVFEKAEGCGLTPLEAANSYLTHRKGLLGNAKHSVAIHRKAANDALTLRNETAEEKP